MRERCYRACLQHGRRWEMGDERQVDRFNEDGSPILTPFFRLVEGREVVEEEPNANLFRTPKQAADDDLANLKGDRVFAIRAALEQLNPDLNSDWTVKGDPSMQRVHALTGGLEVQRGDLLEAWPEFDREFARSLKS